jgi:hypothetical protein
VPSEQEGRQARIQAERDLRATADQWATIHQASSDLEQARRLAGPDPFLEGLAQTMTRRTRRNNGGPA